MKKYFKCLILTLVMIMLSITTVNAKSSKDLFQAGDKVSIEDKLDGTAFIAGNEIKINNTIDGIGFVAGNKLNFNANQEYVIGAGNEIIVEKDVEKDLFLAGNDIKINGNVLRDTYLAANTITINGNLNRNSYIYASEVTLKGTFNGNVTVYATNINIEGAKITGTLKYNKDAVIDGLNNTIKTKTYNTTSNKITFKEYMYAIVSKYVHITMLAIVLVFVCEKLFKKSLKQTEDLTAKKTAILCGKGFLILIGVPMVALMLLMTGIFSSVGVIGGIIYGILVYIANIFTAYTVAHKLDKKYFKKNMNSYILMIVGLFIIYVLSYIPYIGGFVSLLSLLFGLGVSGNMIIEMKK